MARGPPVVETAAPMRLPWSFVVAGLLAAAFATACNARQKPAPPDLAPVALPSPVVPNLPPPPPPRFVDTRCPDDMAPIPTGGCIDRFEASAAPGSKKGAPVAASVRGRPPLVDLTLAESARACERARKRLCRDAEWLAACRGRRGTKYPYGDDFAPRRCHDWDASDHGARGVVKAGTYPECVTPEGVYDLANNAGERTATEDHPGRYVVRGGTFNMTISDSACAEDDYTLTATDHGRDVGFRCCSDGKPM